jgi:hypothetical protein
MASEHAEATTIPLLANDPQFGGQLATLEELKAIRRDRQQEVERCREALAAAKQPRPADSDASAVAAVFDGDPVAVIATHDELVKQLEAAEHKLAEVQQAFTAQKRIVAETRRSAARRIRGELVGQHRQQYAGRILAAMDELRDAIHCELRFFKAMRAAGLLTREPHTGREEIAPLSLMRPRFIGNPASTTGTMDKWCRTMSRYVYGKDHNDAQ